MFVTLTSADDGRPIDIRADDVQAIQTLDQKTTHVFLKGGGELMVRETREKVRERLTWALEFTPVGTGRRAGL